MSSSLQTQQCWTFVQQGNAVVTQMGIKYGHIQMNFSYTTMLTPFVQTIILYKEPFSENHVEAQGNLRTISLIWRKAWDHTLYLQQSQHQGQNLQNLQNSVIKFTKFNDRIYICENSEHLYDKQNMYICDLNYTKTYKTF